MSLGIVFKGPEGIVLAADSRVTLTAENKKTNTRLPAYFDNATKLLKVGGQDYVGAVTYGVGAISTPQGPRTAHSFIPEFEDDLRQRGVGRLSVPDFAKELSDFFMRQWPAPPPTQGAGRREDMTFLVGGYDENQPYGRVFEVYIPSIPTPKETMPGSSDFGVTWGGQREHIDRLIRGFDDNLPEQVKSFLSLSDQQRDDLKTQLTTTLSTPIPYQFLPLQDCVDLSIFLIRTTIKLQTWLVGIRGVGGYIDVATITRTEGFDPVQKKEIKGED